MATWILNSKNLETGTVFWMGKTRAATRAAAVEAFVAGGTKALWYDPRRHAFPPDKGQLYPMGQLKGWDGLGGYAAHGGLYWLSVVEDSYCVNCGSVIGLDCGDAEPDYDGEHCSAGCFEEAIAANGWRP